MNTVRWLAIVLGISLSLWAAATLIAQAPPAGENQRPATDEPAWVSHLRRSDNGFKYSSPQVRTRDTGTYVEFSLTSQIWQGSPWTHKVVGFWPQQSPAPDLVLLFLQGTPSGETLETAAAATGLACAIVGGFPPADIGPKLLDNPRRAFEEYGQTHDPTWSPLCPMAAVAIRTMDAIDAVSAEKLQQPARRYILAGHSRCGLTSLWAAGLDRRVAAIAPIGPPGLDFCRQIERDPSFILNNSILKPGDAATDAGRGFLELIDPYTLRDTLTVPKLFILGTNDFVCLPATLSLYWDGLPGPKWIVQLANTTHGGPNGEMSHPATRGGLYALARAMADGGSLPKVVGRFTESDGRIRLEMTSSAAAKGARLWTAEVTPGHELKFARWESRPATPASGSGDDREIAATYHAEAAMPGKGSTLALFGELEYEDQGISYWLATEFHLAKP